MKKDNYYGFVDLGDIEKEGKEFKERTGMYWLEWLLSKSQYLLLKKSLDKHPKKFIVSPV